MQIVIDLPKEAYEYINTTSKLGWLSDKEFAEVIKNGIILPKGHGRKFKEIVVEYPPADLCAYPEYRGKPYFSIKYEENGEHIIGFGTYNPKVFSKYLQEYFITPTIIEADKESEVVGKIHCTFTDAEIAKSFIEDVDAVKELLPQAESEESE